MEIIARQHERRIAARCFTDQQQPAGITTRRHAGRHQLAGGKRGRRHQAAGVGAGGGGVADAARQRIAAQHRRAGAGSARQARASVINIKDRRRIGRLGKALPAQQAARLITPFAGPQAQRRQIGAHRHRPAHRIGRHNAGGERRARHLFLQKAQHVQRTLAVTGKDDRPTWRLRFQEARESRLHISIGQPLGGLGKAPRFGRVGKETAQHRLAVMRRPQRAGRRQRAGFGAQEASQPQRRCRIAGTAVPLRIAKGGGGRNEEHRHIAPGHGRRAFRQERRGIIGPILQAARPRRPTGRITIIIGRAGCGGFKRAARHQRRAEQAVAGQPPGKGGHNDKDDGNRHQPQEQPRQPRRSFHARRLGRWRGDIGLFVFFRHSFRQVASLVVMIGWCLAAVVMHCEENHVAARRTA